MGHVLTHMISVGSACVDGEILSLEGAGYWFHVTGRGGNALALKLRPQP